MNRTNCFLLMALLMPVGSNSYGQFKEKKHHVKITLTNGRKVKGVISSIGVYNLQLENVIYRRSRGVQPVPDSTIQNNQVHYSNIQKIKIRGTIGEAIGGFFVGTVVGVFGGGILGLAVPCEECEPSERLGLIVLVGGLGGAILGPVGAIDGPFIVHREIAGQYSNYEKFTIEMQEKEMRRMKKKTRK